MRDGVYLARYQGSPLIKLATKTFTILIITDISILDISSIISNLTETFPQVENYYYKLFIDIRDFFGSK